jgi:hypothetical protein
MWHTWEIGETCKGFWWESPKGKDHLKDQGVDGRMGSKWTLGRLVGEECGVDSPGSLAGCCECGDEPSGSGATDLISYVLLYHCGRSQNIRFLQLIHVNIEDLNVLPVPVFITDVISVFYTIYHI